ncbi:phage tail tube protein [Microbacterium sp. NPDC055599]
MAAETVPASTQSDGRWRITNLPSGSNAKSVAILNGGTAKPITYGITAGGWNHTVNQATVEDKRLTLIQDLSRPGKVTEALEVTVVESDDAASADRILSALAASQAESQFVVRRAVANADTHAVGQRADVITGVVGVRRPDAPTENGVDTAKYAIYITKPTERDAVLVA